MSIPQRRADQCGDGFPALLEPESIAKRQPTGLDGDCDPEAAIALLSQFMDEPSDDPKAD